MFFPWTHGKQVGGGNKRSNEVVLITSELCINERLLPAHLADIAGKSNVAMESLSLSSITVIKTGDWHAAEMKNKAWQIQLLMCVCERVNICEEFLIDIPFCISKLIPTSCSPYAHHRGGYWSLCYTALRTPWIANQNPHSAGNNVEVNIQFLAVQTG